MNEHDDRNGEAVEDNAGIEVAAPPFDNTRDSRYFFPSVGHAEALSRLEYLVADRNMGIGLLTGEIGCGKTLTRTVLHRRLLEGPNTVVSLENGLLDFDGLLLEIISQMRRQRVSTESMPDRYSRLASFKKTLMRDINDAGRHLVILLDEAQQLETGVLEQLRGLTNIAAERENFLTVVLIGQPELRHTLRRLPQIDQRISLRYHLNPLSLDETRHYLRHRLNVAGLRGPYPFDADAERLVYESSGGIPREINRQCKLALEHAGALGTERLDKRVVERVVADLNRHRGQDEGLGEPA